MRRTIWLKLGLATILLIGVAWLFLKTVHNTIAEPYSVDASALTSWTLTFHETSQPAPALIALVPPSNLVATLFQQIFHRTMQSLMTPAEPIMPIVLQSEFMASLHEVLSPVEILEAARAAGLEHAQFDPVCMAVKREPAEGRTRQLYFVVFESQAFTDFRQELARRYREGEGTSLFDPIDLDLVLPIASSDADFAAWWPLKVDQPTDCRADLL